MGKKVIVIDDSKTIREMVRFALEHAGYSIVEAVDGKDGFEKLKSTSDLSMAIVDVNMPNMSGIDMLEALKKGSIAQNVPAIMLTTEGQAALIQRAKQAGARGWMVKPFKPDQLVATVGKLAGPP
jgi:two-component system chemotaxis response regulator CheY